MPGQREPQDVIVGASEVSRCSGQGGEEQDSARAPKRPFGWRSESKSVLGCLGVITMDTPLERWRSEPSRRTAKHFELSERASM